MLKIRVSLVKRSIKSTDTDIVAYNRLLSGAFEPGSVVAVANALVVDDHHSNLSNAPDSVPFDLSARVSLVWTPRTQVSTALPLGCCGMRGSMREATSSTAVERTSDSSPLAWPCCAHLNGAIKEQKEWASSSGGRQDIGAVAECLVKQLSHAAAQSLSERSEGQTQIAGAATPRREQHPNAPPHRQIEVVGR